VVEKSFNIQHLAIPEKSVYETDFAERYLATGRFKEAAMRLAALLADPKLDPGVRIALRTLEIATLLALDQTTSIPFRHFCRLTPLSHLRFGLLL
jgi:hypothetical protein